MGRLGDLAKITLATAGAEGSKWRWLPKEPPRGASSRTAQKIDSSASFVRWLRSTQINA